MKKLNQKLKLLNLKLETESELKNSTKMYLAKNAPKIGRNFY